MEGVKPGVSEAVFKSYWNLWQVWENLNSNLNDITNTTLTVLTVSDVLERSKLVQACNMYFIICTYKKRNIILHQNNVADQSDETRFAKKWTNIQGTND